MNLGTSQRALGGDIYIPNSKELFNKIHEHKEDIESELGTELRWMALPSRAREQAFEIKIDL